MNPILRNASRPEVMKLAAIKEMEKNASVASHAIEVTGLGVLARPSIRHLQGKEQSERSGHAHEVAGLGMLAAPSALHLGSAGLKKVSPTTHARIAATKAGKFLAKHAADFGGTGRMLVKTLNQGVAKPAVQQATHAVGQAAAAAPKKKKLTMDMIQAAKKRMAGGGHGGIY